MGKLVYSTSASLDGYIEDGQGGFAWSRPDEEVHRFANDLIRPFGTHLYGRRLYETMAVWETDPGLAGDNEITRDFAGIWRSADKVVYSTSLSEPLTQRTRLEREFKPDAVRQMKEAAERDLLIGGATLAKSAFEVGLIDEVELRIVPVAVGGGKPALPPGMKLDLELLDEHRFAGGTVHLLYAVR